VLLYSREDYAQVTSLGISYTWINGRTHIHIYINMYIFMSINGIYIHVYIYIYNYVYDTWRVRIFSQTQVLSVREFIVFGCRLLKDEKTPGRFPDNLEGQVMVSKF